MSPPGAGREALPIPDGDGGAPESPSAAVALERIKQRREFLRVAAAQRKWVTPGVILQACPNVSGSSPLPVSDGRTVAKPVARVGFTCSRKVGNSVARNRARRRLRAAAAAILPLAAEPGWDYVLIGRPATLDRTFDDLLRDLRTAVKRVRTAVPGSSPHRGGKPGKGKAGPPGRGSKTGTKPETQSGAESDGP